MDLIQNFGKTFGSDRIMSFEEARKHPNWNESKLRIMLPSEVIGKMSVKVVTLSELREIKCSVFFNPFQIAYPGSKFIVNGEVGHDLNYRYLVSE